MLDFLSFANQTKIKDESVPSVNTSAIDIIFVGTCVAHHNFKNNAERDLNRYEFLEIILRLAIAKYKETGIVSSTAEAINKLLEENIYPHADYMDGDHFRKYYCYNVKVNEILKKNEAQLRRVYSSYIHPKKKYITADEAISYCHKVGLPISDQMI